jgi:hypothetical protein
MPLLPVLVPLVVLLVQLAVLSESGAVELPLERLRLSALRLPPRLGLWEAGLL